MTLDKLNMNLLFTCVGRRNYLLEYFKSIPGVTVVACDADIYAPALHEADDFFIVPVVINIGYVQQLLKESKERNIDAIISLNDIELPILAESKHLFDKEGIRVIVSNKDIIDLCFDKYQTYLFTEELSVKPIPTFLHVNEALDYQKKNPDCQFIIKPRWGSASFGLEYPKNNEELEYLFSQLKVKLKESPIGSIHQTDDENSLIIQKRLNGTEYGMDVINNLEGEYERTLLRKKLAMRGGETDKAETVCDERLEKIGEEIGKKLKHVGNLDCDLFIEDEDIYLLEMNPRFGGGYPFMQTAGTDLPRALVEWLRGNLTPPGVFNYQEGVVAAKVDKLVVLNEDHSNEKANVYIIGAGGFGREIESWLNLSARFNESCILKGYIDDMVDALDGYPSDYRILGTIDEFQFGEGDFVLLGIGDPVLKQDIVERLNGRVRFLSFISDTAKVGKYNTIGEGAVIAPHAVISTNVTLGRFTTINLGSHIGHDSTIADYSSLMANVDLSGKTRIGKGVYIGSNATVFPSKQIGDHSKISAGSIVVTNIKENSLCGGNPAREFSKVFTKSE